MPPAYFMFANFKNTDNGILKLRATLLIIELLSIILEKESLSAGRATQRSPD